MQTLTYRMTQQHRYEESVELLAGHCVIMRDIASSVTVVQHQLNWQNLQQHQLLYKALNDHIALQVVPLYYTLSHSNTRANHQFSCIHPSTRTNVYKYTVAHNRLLNKLKFYGIQGKVYDWLSIWLTQRTQHVVLDGFWCSTRYSSWPYNVLALY